MTFLQPALLLALPLAALPVVIHLIHLYRRRQVKWAAMMFLLAAQSMNRGFSRLRQILILLLRVLALAAIIFTITRPLAGGWLGLMGGAPDTVIVLLDRSASMEEHNPATGVSKRLAGLRNISKAITDAVGTRSKLVLIDSALGKPVAVEKPSLLADLPQSEPSDTAADIPGLLQGALDYITANKTGRTDVWMLSDLQQSDWDASGGRWEVLRSAFATLQGVRFHLLCYPQPAREDLSVSVQRVVRLESRDKAELLLDLRIERHSGTQDPQNQNAGNIQPLEVPLRFVINGAVTAMKVTLKENQLVMQAYPVAIDRALKRGWGRVELPADNSPANNAYHFVFDEAPVLRSVIVCDDEAEAGPLAAALSATADSTRKYAATVLPVRRAAEIPWAETALIVWQAPVPKPADPLAAQLREHVAAGRGVLFLPPDSPDDTEIFGLHWSAWETAAQTLEWWRNDADLLANTRDGAALPVGTLEVSRRCGIVGDGVPLARLARREPLLVRASPGQTKDQPAASEAGRAYFLGTLPGPGSSSMARDGVVMFAMLHRALNEAGRNLGKARQRLAGTSALGGDSAGWQPVENKAAAVVRQSLPLSAGVLSRGDELAALNRPPGEDLAQKLSEPAVNELFAGLDFRVITDSLEEGRSLTSEIWRTFLTAMALALLAEALLCMPPRRESTASAKTIADPSLWSA